MVSRRVPGRRLEGAGNVGPSNCGQGRIEAHTATRLPSTSHHHIALQCQESSGSFSQKSTLPPLQAQAFLIYFLDHAGHVRTKSSSFLESRLADLAPPERCQLFAQVVAQENPKLVIDQTCFGNYDEAQSSHSGPAPSKTEAPTTRQRPRHKRTLPSETFPVKRRKSSVQFATEDAFIETVESEDESKSESEEEQDDFEEYVGAGSISEIVRIDDDNKVWDVIEFRLKQMDQSNCKIVAKTWIKAKEPRKQTRYPYNGGSNREESIRLYGDKNPGELSKPPWWCSTQGWQQGEGCRHKEPDHLKKAERIHFMKYWLQKVPVDELRESTKEIPPNITPKARENLNEIYSLRRQQERYENKEIDGSTTIAVDMPKVSSSSIKSRVSRLLGTKENTVHEQKHPLTDPESTLMTLGDETASAQLKVEDSTWGSIFDSYTSSMLLDDEYNEIGASNGQDMIFSTPSQSPGQASHTTTSQPIDRLSSRKANLEAIRTSSVPYTEACHSSTKIDNSPCSFGRIAKIPYACTSSLPANAGTNLYDSKFLNSNVPYLHNALPYSGCSNVQDDSLNRRQDNYSMFPGSFSSTTDYGLRDSSMSNPQGSSVQDPFYPLGLSIPQYLCLQTHTMNPLKPDTMNVQPCNLPLHSQRSLQKPMLDDQKYISSSSIFSE